MLLNQCRPSRLFGCNKNLRTKVVKWLFEVTFVTSCDSPKSVQVLLPRKLESSMKDLEDDGLLMSVSKASEKKGMLELHVGCCTHAGGHDSLDWKCSHLLSHCAASSPFPFPGCFFCCCRGGMTQLLSFLSQLSVTQELHSHLAVTFL